jgi:hypothetical protein
MQIEHIDEALDQRAGTSVHRVVRKPSVLDAMRGNHPMDIFQHPPRDLGSSWGLPRQ